LEKINFGDLLQLYMT